jgi:hypothetical protein
MIQKIHEPVSVSTFFDHTRGIVFPKVVIWKNRTYPVRKIGLHHSYRLGRTLYHVFSVVTPTVFLRLVLNTENLSWKLEEVSDGLPS